MNNKIYKAFGITLSFSLSGCMGIYEGGFECPAGVGVGCKSISDVNMMVNQGELPKPQPAQPAANKSDIWYAPSMRRELKATVCPSIQELERQNNKKENRSFDASKSI